jgi:signal transduction histidine kinase
VGRRLPARRRGHAVTLAGWLLAVALTVVVVCIDRRSRGRAELVARACHELRGPLTAAGLALYSAGRQGDAPPRRIAAVDLQLRRAELALTDLSLAPSGGRTRDRVETVAIAELLEAEAGCWREVAWADGRASIAAGCGSRSPTTARASRGRSRS